MRELRWQWQMYWPNWWKLWPAWGSHPDDFGPVIHYFGFGPLQLRWFYVQRHPRV